MYLAEPRVVMQERVVQCILYPCGMLVSLWILDDGARMRVLCGRNYLEAESSVFCLKAESFCFNYPKQRSLLQCVGGEQALMLFMYHSRLDQDSVVHERYQ